MKRTRDGVNWWIVTVQVISVAVVYVTRRPEVYARRRELVDDSGGI